MFLSALLGGLVAAVLFQPTAPRFFAAVVFVSVAWTHEIYFTHLEGFAYHGSAAAADLAIIAALRLLIEPSRVVLILARICLVSMVLNLVGWLMWHAYLPPEPYNAAMLCVFIWALLILTSRDEQDAMGGGLTVDWWRAIICINAYSRAQLLPSNGTRA